MSYRCGIGPGLGLPVSEPTIYCDGVKCDRRVVINGLAPQWFLDGRAPRGWEIVRVDDKRLDFCPKHLEDAEMYEG